MAEQHVAGYHERSQLSTLPALTTQQKQTQIKDLTHLSNFHISLQTAPVLPTFFPVPRRVYFSVTSLSLPA